MMTGGAVQRTACRGACRDGARGAAAATSRSSRSRRTTPRYHHRPTTASTRTARATSTSAFSFVAERAVVEVDDELGLVRVVQIAAAQDAGRVVNPQGAEGQVEGGAAMGLGLALMEELQLDGGRDRATPRSPTT